MVLLVTCRITVDGWTGTCESSKRNVLESIGAAVTSGVRLWKATAPTALHSDYVPERPERRSRM